MSRPQLIQISVTVPAALESNSITPAKEDARQKILNYLAQEFVVQMRERREDNAVEFYLQAYIVTPTQLAQLVQQRAEKMYPHAVWWVESSIKESNG